MAAAYALHGPPRQLGQQVPVRVPHHGSLGVRAVQSFHVFLTQVIVPKRKLRQMFAIWQYDVHVSCSVISMCSEIHLPALISSALSLLHCSNKRYAEFERVQLNLGVPQHQILRGVETRWLSILPALERLLEQYPALLVFFDSVRVSTWMKQYNLSNGMLVAAWNGNLTRNSKHFSLPCLL